MIDLSVGDAMTMRGGNAAARRKELAGLKNTGIVDETEHAAEVKKLEGTGK